MIKILCVELFEATFTPKRSKYTSKITFVILSSSLSFKKHLQNLVGRGLHLLGKECIVW